MSTKATSLLVFAALALGLYVLLIDGRHSRSDNPGPTARLFPDFSPLSVTAVELRLTNGLIRAERIGDGWLLRAPPAVGQKTGVDSLLDLVATLQSLAYLPATTGANSNATGDFGFRPPRAAVRLESGTNRIEFQIGAKTLLREGVYLQKGGDEGIYVTDERLLEHVPNSPNDWRDPRVVVIEREDYDGFVLTNGGRTLSLRIAPGKTTWTMERPVRGARVTQLEVERLLDRINRISAQRFVTDDPKADPETYGLNEPIAELRYMRGTNQALRVWFGKPTPSDSTQVFARSSLHSNIVSVAGSVVENLLRINPNDLRDRRLLEFDPAQVTRIEVTSRTESFTVLRSTNSWRFPNAAVGADPQLVEAFLFRLASLDVAVWENDAVSTYAPYGLERPDLRLALYSGTTNQSTNTPIATAQLSTNNVTARRPDLVYAVRSTNENAVFGINFRDVEALPRSLVQLRNRQIWQFPATNVVSIKATYEGRTNSFTRGTARSWSPDEVLSTGIEISLEKLGEMRAEEWLGQGEERFRSLFPEPRNGIQIEVVKSGATNLHQLVFGGFDSSRRPYASVVAEDGTRLIFNLPATLWTDAIARLLP